MEKNLNINEVSKVLYDWGNENQEKRAFVILAIEEVNADDENKEFSCTAGVCGSEAVLVESLANAFETEDNPVGSIIKKAIKMTALKAIAKAMDEAISDMENEPKDEGEEPEADAQIPETAVETQQNGNN